MIAKIDTLDLRVLKLNAAAYLDRHMLDHAPDVLEFVMHDLPERMAKQLIAQLKLPAQVLQENALIHRSPATAWDHVKQRLRVHFPVLKRWLRVRYVEVRLTENLIYPTVRVPDKYASTVRLATYPSFDTAWD